MDRTKLTVIATAIVIFVLSFHYLLSGSAPNVAGGVQHDYARASRQPAAGYGSSELIDLFIDVVMNTHYNYFPGYIDGSDVPPHANALSMVGKRRLDNFALCVATTVKENIAGDVIETGSWKGGAAFVAIKVLSVLHQRQLRRVYVCDSFKGIPSPPSDRQYNTEDHNANFPVFSEASSKRLLADAQRFGVTIDPSEVLEGYFNVTLPALVASHPNIQFSVIRLDGDTYFSTMDALRTLYSHLSPGGFVIVDDYIDWAGCREAVDDFRRQQGIRDPVVLVPHRDGEILRGAYWRKGSADVAAGPRLNRLLCLGHNGEAEGAEGTGLLVPVTSFRPEVLVSVPTAGPLGLVYDKKVFAGRSDLKMCVASAP
jgi:O-methyltransferase